MNKWVLWRLTLVAAALVSTAGAMDLATMVKEHKAASAMLTARALVLTREGHVAVPYKAGEAAVTAVDALDSVQAAYAQLLPEGEKPEFTITCRDGHLYSYVNREGQKSTVDEVWKKGDDKEFNVVYYATGKRFFGHFQALIHLQATPNAKGQVDYRLLVRASPENRFWRFVVSRIGVVKLFFRSKTDEVAGLSEQILVRLCQQPSAARAEPVEAAVVPSSADTTAGP